MENHLTNIYFVQSAIGGPIKIGHSRNLERRLSELQIGCPFKLNLVFIIENVYQKCEKMLHEKFKKYHVHGEWYSERILDVIQGEQEERHWLDPMP